MPDATREIQNAAPDSAVAQGTTPRYSQRQVARRIRILSGRRSAGPWLPHPLTAAAESRRSSRSAARKNGLDADTRISDHKAAP